MNDKTTDLPTNFDIFSPVIKVGEGQDPQTPLQQVRLSSSAPILRDIGKASGWVPEPSDHRDWPLSKMTSVMSTYSPDSASLNRQNLSPVRDQMTVGSCTGMAVAAAVEYLRRKPTEDFWETLYSPLFPYWFARKAIGMTDVDSGAYIRDAVKSVAHHGIARESDWKYYQPTKRLKVRPSDRAIKSAASWKLGAYYRCSGLSDVKQAIAADFPVVGGFLCFSNLGAASTWDTGIVLPPSGSIQGGHAVLFVGYDDNRRLVTFENSWGEDWGEKGYGYLPYQFFEKGLTSDLWVLESECPTTR